jgi:GT2 family glycosyltransferase
LPPATEPLSSRTEKKQLPRVGVVILNHNGRELAENCVESVLDAAYPNRDIIVVDNASSDGSAAYLRSAFPGVTVLSTAENLGVTGGRNVGFREAVRRGNEYVLSLDNDTRIDRDLIDYLVEAAESDRTIGVVGPKTYVDDSSGKLQCTGGLIAYTQNVCVERGAGERDRGQYDEMGEVDYFPGCGFMARREVFEQLNYLDETFYGYGHEDTDFCFRAARLGHRVVYVPTAVMWHKGSTTVGGYSPRRKYLEAVNSAYFVRKYATPGQRLKYAFFAGFGLIYALIVQSMRGNHRAVFAKARGLWDGMRKPLA